MSTKLSPQLAARRRMIRVACTQLGIDDAERREIMRTVAGVASSNQLTLEQCDQVVAHLKKAGFKVRIKQGGGKSRALADDVQSGKIRALWLTLAELGAVQDPSERALAGYVKRITKVEALQWLSAPQAQQLTETLKQWALRFLPAAVEARLTAAGGALGAKESAIVHALIARATYDSLLDAWQRLGALPTTGEH